MAAGTPTQLRAVQATQDTEVFLDVDALAARYGIGRGKSYELVASRAPLAVAPPPPRRAGRPAKAVAS